MTIFQIRKPASISSAVVTALGLLIALSLSGCSNSPSSESSSSITVSGQAINKVGAERVSGVASWARNWDFWCATKHSKKGAKVTIKDSEGKVVGLATIGSPVADITVNKKNNDEGIVYGTCTGTFETDVDSKSKFFTVEVEGYSGSVSKTRAELVSGLSLNVP